MLHKARVPPRSLSPTETNPVNDIKRQLKQITNIHDNLKRSYDQTQTKIQTVAAPTQPTAPPKTTPSVSQKLAWSHPTRNQFSTTTPNPKLTQRPYGGPPPSAPPPGPQPQILQNPNPIGGTEEPLQGKEPPIFNGD